jgi:hypothetical protein
MSPLCPLFLLYVPFTSPFKISMSPCFGTMSPLRPPVFFTSWLNLVAFHSIFSAFLANFFVHLHRSKCSHHWIETHPFSLQSLILYTSYHVVTRSFLLRFEVFVKLLQQSLFDKIFFSVIHQQHIFSFAFCSLS